MNATAFSVVPVTIAPAVAAPQTAEDAVAIAAIARQVQPCYRPPAAAGDDHVVTFIDVEWADGSRATAARLADAALRAVKRCVPMRSPSSDGTHGTKAFRLTFSAKGVA